MVLVKDVVGVKNPRLSRLGAKGTNTSFGGRLQGWALYHPEGGYLR